MDNLTVTNKALVTQAMTATMIKHDVSAFDRWWSDHYLQHDQNSPDGTEHQKKTVSMIATLPGFSFQIVRAIADHDLVAVQGRMAGMGPAAMIVWSLFRVENGKLAEHWSAATPETAQSANGHTQLDGATEVKDLDKTEANKRLFHQALQSLFIEGHFDQLGTYYDANLIQHNPLIPNGLAGLMKGAEAMAAQGMTMQLKKVHRILGEGNFVLAHSEGTFGGKPAAFVDLVRIENGKIIEHWDVIQPVPEGEPKNKNGMF